MKIFRSLVLAVLSFFVYTHTMAQDTLNFKGKHYEFIGGMADTVNSDKGNYIIKYIVQPEMKDAMTKNGKIYVVVVVLATIFAGIFAYLVYLDRKIGKLEKENVS